MNGATYILTGLALLVMITWGAAARRSTRQLPHDPILIICACLIPPVLWLVALQRFFRVLVGLPGNLPIILAAFCTLCFASTLAGIPINRHSIALSAALFAIVEPILVYLAAQAYWRYLGASENSIDVSHEGVNAE